MYHPVPNGTNDNVVHEFVELHNLTASTVPLYHPSFTTNTWREPNRFAASRTARRAVSEPS